MAPKKGTTNNPHGRPKKDRALTDLLMRELSHTIEIDGKSISGKRLIAKSVVDAVTTGKVKFPKDTEDSVISVKDWIDFIKWLYVHIDGSVKTEVDVTSNGKEINQIDGYDRAISTLANAIRKVVPGQSTEQSSQVDSAK